MQTRDNLRKTTLLAGAALLSTGAMAIPPTEQTITQTEIVRFSAPESATHQGAMTLYGKLQAAAFRVCSELVPATMIPAVDRTCAANALNKAVADVGSPLLVAMHQQKHAGSAPAKPQKELTMELETLASR